MEHSDNSNPTHLDPYRVVGRVARLGVQICVGLPVLLFLLAMLLRNSFDFLATPVSANLEVVGYAFIAVALMDLVAAFVLKKRMMTPAALRRRFDPHPGALARQLSSAYIPIFAVAAAPALYGLIFYLIGGDLETYVLLSVFCPAGLMLLKPKVDEIEELAEQLFRR